MLAIGQAEEHEVLEQFDILFLSPHNEDDDESDKDYKAQYEILSSNQIVENMNDYLEEINEIANLNPTITRILLDHFRWDKEKFYEEFFGDNKDNMFVSTNLIFCVCMLMASGLTLEDGQCSICSDDCTLINYGCDHAFCNDCWVSYVTNKIVDEGESSRIHCAAFGCEIFFEDQTIYSMLEQPDVLTRYQRNVSNSYVRFNRYLTWCPKPGCTNAIKVDDLGSQLIECRCGKKFCFKCSEDWHEPIDCDTLVKWKRDSAEQRGETYAWLAKNTRECPQCKAPIEKNGGCNHMSCKGCSFEFCWLCLETYNSSHSCHRYVEKPSTAQANRQRLEFYSSRYENQKASLKLDLSLYEEKIRYKKIPSENKVLKAAIDSLEMCRLLLTHSYVFAYLQESTNYLSIFEENQKDLGNAVEILSEYLEKDFLKIDEPEMCVKVMDKYKYCNTRRKILLKFIEEGYEQKLWKSDD